MATFMRLVDLNSADLKEMEIHSEKHRYHLNQNNFKKIPGSPVAYWVSERVLDTFCHPKVDDVFVVRQGIATGDNAVYLRYWTEISYAKFNLRCSSAAEAISSGQKWFPHNKGGELRKWWGNQDWVISYDKKSRDLLKAMGNHCPSESLYFKPSISWSDVTTGDVGFRVYPQGFVFDATGHSGFPSGKLMPTILAISNSKIVKELSSILNPTMHFHVGYYKLLPILYTEDTCNNTEPIVNKLIAIAKVDWDIRESSWNFLRSPLLTNYTVRPSESRIDNSLYGWNWPSALSDGKAIDLDTQASSFIEHLTRLFIELQTSEVELNSVFINLYGLTGELTPEIPYHEITILKDELIDSERRENRIKFDQGVLAQQFISYGVGCLFGRYSVEKDGLILADAGSTIEKFKSKIPDTRFLPDEDGILPLTDEDDFSDDLPTAFTSWLRFISGSRLEDNLRWIEERLCKDLRGFFDRDFYKDHIRRYKSRPIYWMVSSPSGAFRALIYLHRYTKDTVGKILNDYVRPYRAKIDKKIRGLESIIDSTGSGPGEKTKAKKRLAQLEKYRTEIEAWEKESLYPLALKRVELDLDDGVKLNYQKLEGILEPVKQLEGKEEE